MPWGNLPAEPIGSLPRLRSSLVGAHLKANYVLPFSQLALRELSLGSSGLLWPEDRSIKPNTLCLQRGTDRWSRQMVYTGGLDRWWWNAQLSVVARGQGALWRSGKFPSLLTRRPRAWMVAMTWGMFWASYKSTVWNKSVFFKP